MSSLSNFAEGQFLCLHKFMAGRGAQHARGGWAEHHLLPKDRCIEGVRKMERPPEGSPER